ncbi:hypothetical protein FIV07_12200 [Mycobacterium sp. THAF192]|nr:hypothetical protein FIV07_12200 [Mycobacterium sp. THAF192]
MTHRCDTSSDPSNTPLTRARVRRLLASLLQQDYSAMEAVFDEVAGCRDCLQRMTIMMAGAAAEHMPHPELHELMAVDLELDAYLDDPSGGDGS